MFANYLNPIPYDKHMTLCAVITWKLQGDSMLYDTAYQSNIQNISFVRPLVVEGHMGSREAIRPNDLAALFNPNKSCGLCLYG